MYALYGTTEEALYGLHGHGIKGNGRERKSIAVQTERSGMGRNATDAVRRERLAGWMDGWMNGWMDGWMIQCKKKGRDECLV